MVPAVTDAGPAIFLVESGSPGFGVSRQLGIDLTRRVCVTTFDTTPAFLLCHGEAAVAVLDRAEHELLLATAAEAAGGIGWCLDASIEYVQDREQFGGPIGSFEAVAHSCVDMLANLQSVSAAARYAAVASADGAAEARMAANVAALRAGEAYRGVTESAIHLFGGIGFTWEHDAYLYYRRAWSAERLTGGPHAHRTAMGDIAGPVRSGGAGRWFVGAGAQRRRLSPHRADEQAVQRLSFLGAQGTEQFVLDPAEPGVGAGKFVLAAGRQLDDVPAAVSGIAATRDEPALLELVEQADDVARIQAQTRPRVPAGSPVRNRAAASAR